MDKANDAPEVAMVDRSLHQVVTDEKNSADASNPGILPPQPAYHSTMSQYGQSPVSPITTPSIQPGMPYQSPYPPPMAPYQQGHQYAPGPPSYIDSPQPAQGYPVQPQTMVYQPPPPAAQPQQDGKPGKAEANPKLSKKGQAGALAGGAAVGAGLYCCCADCMDSCCCCCCCC